MQKKVIALAVAALASGVAMAQSNVTVYGIMDAAYLDASPKNDGSIVNGAGGKTNIANTVNKQRGIDDGAVGSRIGFKGEEGLGNGLKTEFLYELGLAPTNNVGVSNNSSAGSGYASGTTSQISTNNFQTRQAYVALNSSLVGQFAAGRFQTAGWDFQAGSRPWGGLDPIRTMTNIFGIASNTSDRVGNALRWTSPSWAGVTLSALYSFDASPTADIKTNDQTYQNTNGVAMGRQTLSMFQAKYVNGPIYANSYYRLVNQTAGQLFDDGRNEWGLSGAYDFSVVKVGLNYQKVNMNAARSNTAPVGQPPVLLNNYVGSWKQGKVFSGYVTVPFGSSFKLSVIAAKASGDLSTGGNAYGLYGEYILSKRTSAYAQAARFNTNNNNAALGNTLSLGSYSSAANLEAGKSMNAGMVGLVHSF